MLNGYFDFLHTFETSDMSYLHMVHNYIVLSRLVHTVISVVPMKFETLLQTKSNPSISLFDLLAYQTSGMSSLDMVHNYVELSRLVHTMKLGKTAPNKFQS